MPIILIAILRQVVMGAITVAAADVAAKLLEWINDKFIEYLKSKFGLSDDDAVIVVSNEILTFTSQVAGAVVVLRARVPFRVADRLGLTTKGYVKREVSASGKAKLAAAAQTFTKTAAKDLAGTLLKVISFPAAIIWTVKAAADIIEPGAYQTEQINAIYRSLGIPYQYPTKEPTPQPGPFDTAQWRDFLAGVMSKKPIGLSDPYAGQTKLFSEAALIDIANAVYGDALADGKTPTAKEFGPMVAQYIIFTPGQSVATGTYSSGSVGGSTTTQPTGTVATQIKIYTGVVANGALGTPQEFVARPDDMIQNADELKSAAKINLAALYQALPGRFYYEIAIVSTIRTRAGFTVKGAPVQVVRSYKKDGTPNYKTIYHKFAVMRIFVTDRLGKNVKLEEITLGPVNVVDFQPTPAQLTDIADKITPETFTADIGAINQIITSQAVAVTPTTQYTPAPTTAPAGGMATPVSQPVSQTPVVSAPVNPPPAPPPVQASSPAPAQVPVYTPGIAKTLPLNEAAGVAFSYGWMGSTSLTAIAQYQGVALDDLLAVNRTWWQGMPLSNYQYMDISTMMRNYNVPPINIPYPRTSSPAAVNSRLSTATNLSEAYAALGKDLAPLATRANLYQSWGLGAASTYAGTAEQNAKLLAEIKKRGAVS